MQIDAAFSNVSQVSVSELSAALKKTLEDRFGYVRVRGEISGYRGPHSSGHAYFSLKDENARLDAVIWRTTFSRMNIKPEEGLEVIASGRLSTFPGKSAYQIVVETLEPAGVGALMALLENRRQQLSNEGLFNTQRKRKLPFLPRVIGVVTSATGAVIRDILHRLSDRFPVHVLVWPVRVQGEGSAAELVAAVNGFSNLPKSSLIARPDVVIVARGGGSLEDLWSFNDEMLVRAIAASEIPVISAVGHETDWTLIDHVADLRAPTPTAAAELSVPVRSELISRVERAGAKNIGALTRDIRTRLSSLRSSGRSIASSKNAFTQRAQTLDACVERLQFGVRSNLGARNLLIVRLDNGLAKISPAMRIAIRGSEGKALAARLSIAVRRHLATQRLEVRRIEKSLLVAGAMHRIRRSERARGLFAHLQSRLEGTGRLPPIRRRELVLIGDRFLRASGNGAGRRKMNLARLVQVLDVINYRAIIARGFALILDNNGKMLANTRQLKAAKVFTIRMGDGDAVAAVKARRSKATEYANDRKSGQGKLL